MNLRRFTERSLMRVGVNLFSRNKDDRRVLERIILPAIAADPRYSRVLFVGCDYYTRPYFRLFGDREYWTIELDPKRARYGAARHVVGAVEDLPQHFAPGFLDAIICNGVIGFGLNSLEAAERAISSCYECLRPEGLFVLGWADTPKWRPFSLAESTSLGRFERHYFRALESSEYLTKTDYRHVYSFYARPSMLEDSER